MAGDPAKPTLRAIEVFVAVAETGNLGAAAGRLRASPSSVSQQVTNLEAALRVRLIDRSARPFVLTSAGRLFLKRARTVLDEIHKARRELAEIGHGSLSVLHIALIEDLEAEATPSLALALSDALPDCHITCHTGPSHLNFEALSDRAVDIALAAEIEALSDEFEQHPVLRDPFVLATAKGLITEDAGMLDTLRKAPMIGYAASQLMQRQIFAQLQRLRFDATASFEFDTNHAALATVARTGGWTITTPLGFFRAQRLHDQLEMRRLPMPAFARTLSIYARTGLLGRVPEMAADILRRTIADEVVRPAYAAAPWLEPDFRILKNQPLSTDGTRDRQAAE